MFREFENSTDRYFLVSFTHRQQQSHFTGCFQNKLYWITNYPRMFLDVLFKNKPSDFQTCVCSKNKMNCELLTEQQLFVR